ncbi:TPA: ATP-dependent DNA ligase [archaeon]|jgi:DNA ligase-1|uniref:DNA ligase n=1 Tax=Candidatus Undinarchaeum marinum TaxID=2756141 RepID=A0A832XLE8_9ARCH|nr:ATP-dependent DNA ligase [Candidatus Undinarchaeum marinum]
MKYGKLVDSYRKLSSTSKKLEKTSIVAKLLKSASDEDTVMLAMLFQGRIFPEWDETELGVADSIMIKTLIRISGVSESEIKLISRKTGDLGDAAEKILEKRKQTTLHKKSLSLDDVYSNLQKIPTIGGVGSVEKRMSLISELLSSATPEEGKYITRTILQTLRLGVGEGTMRDSIAKAYGVEPSLVERAHNIRNDFGEVATLAREQGESGLKKLSLEVGRPLKPMLAKKTEGIENAVADMGGIAAWEIKYDGMRVQIHKKGSEIRVFTRRLDDVSKQFYDIVELASESISAKDCILEGEAVGVDPNTRRPLPFQQLSRRIKRKYDIEELSREIPVTVNLFDILYLDGKSLLDSPFEERRKLLVKSVNPSGSKFAFAEQLISGEKKKIKRFYERALSMGHEGLMAKNLKAKYTPGSRVKHMYKLKPEMESLDLVIIGAIWGEGRRASWLGSFILGARDPDTSEFVEVGKVATGLTDENLKKLTEILKPLITKDNVSTVDVRPKIVVEVGYEEIQKSPTYRSGFALRFPRVKEIRDDKGPEDADSVERVARLYELQRK